MIKAATLMLVYAAALLLIGVITYLAAPTGASAATAIIVPAVCAALMITCAVLAVIGASSAARGRGPGKPGMIGIHLGLLLPLLFALAFIFRAMPATSNYLEAKGNISSGTPIEQATTVLNDDSRNALHKDYLVVALWSLTGLSAYAFASLVVLRPKSAKSASPAAAD